MSASDAALRQIIQPVRHDVAAAGAAHGAVFVVAVAQAGALGFALAALGEQHRLDWTLIAVWLALSALRLALGLGADMFSARAGAQAKLLVRSHVASRTLAGGALADADGSVAAINDDAESFGGFVARHEPLRLAMPLGVMAALAFAFSQSWVAGALLLLTGPLTPLFMALVGYRAQDEAKSKLDALADMSRYFMGRLRLMDVIRAFGAEAREAERMARFANSHRAASVGVLRIAFLSSATIDFFATLSIALVATYVGMSLLGLMPFATGETLSAAEGFAVLLVAPEFFAPLRRFALAYHDRADARAAVERVKRFYDEPVSAPVAAANAVLRDVSPGAMRLEAVQVGFENGAVTAPVDALFVAGRLHAVSGASGAGKSALLKTLAGLLSPVAGRMGIDAALGVPLLVGQSPFLFPGTVRENLAFGLEDASDAALIQALCDVGLAEARERALALLDRRVSDVVAGVSGGEARRIAIARALVRDAPVLLLDEPTAHLDYKSERALIETLVRLGDARIVIAASHSPLVWAAAGQVIAVRAA